MPFNSYELSIINSFSDRKWYDNYWAIQDIIENDKMDLKNLSKVYHDDNKVKLLYKPMAIVRLSGDIGGVCDILEWLGKYTNNLWTVVYGNLCNVKNYHIPSINILFEESTDAMAFKLRWM